MLKNILEFGTKTSMCLLAFMYRNNLLICNDVLQKIGYIKPFFFFKRLWIPAFITFFFPWQENKCLLSVFLVSTTCNLRYIRIQNECALRKYHMLPPLSYSLIVNCKHKMFSMEICWFVSGCSWQWVNNRLLCHLFLKSIGCFAKFIMAFF